MISWNFGKDLDSHLLQRSPRHSLKQVIDSISSFVPKSAERDMIIKS